MLDRIPAGLTELLHQAGMRWHPAHPLLAPLRAIDHLRQVFVQNASLRIDSYGDQWLCTIPPAASRLLQSAAGKQLRQETWDKNIATEAILSDKNLLLTNPTVSAAAPRCCSQTCIALNLCPSMSQAFFLKTLSGKEATPMSFAPVVMLPQVPLSGVQPPVSAKPMPGVPLTSQTSYGITLPPQSLSALSAPDERDSFLVTKQVCSQLPLSLSACVLVRPFRLVNRRCGSSQISRQSQKHLRRFQRSQRCLQTCAGGMAARRKQGPAAWPSQGSKIAAEVRNRMAALGSTMAVVVRALEMERERIPATRTVSSLQQLCSRYSSDSKLLGKRTQSS